ncbi:MAG TPA: glycosyltransferase [Cyanobacteria bacterium UBA11149]|nr:glycosyltransferase [Cyanobacteria bacterium UBA11367]HBE56635.1 glycosyltransferase [Cyanobacteria bacterium UBA11366]HBK65159.1 glycosyltransferase [Cyanobacteria bacterium UBA11166]HBR74777.1 glycosyltransferase [Cyanobacteria bacterium UBA11159]HBS70033.1 glycosyltransferase [Cyanobacteria bacterium UBA11153]HBW92009.1 glycosyltransferase [Cyanobacteria bacterium UBA11149]HCA95906.1 glycosyltransferase [Cyanobacteria bacterium UBA9226]
MTLPLLSVIIPTYGPNAPSRDKLLRDTLANVLEQDYPSFEIIVVDQTPTHDPQTQAYLEKLAGEKKIDWYRVNWASLPGARNYGVRRASGEIIVFIDDDIIMPPGYLAAHARNYSNPEIGTVAGRVFDKMKLSETGNWKEGEAVREDLVKKLPQLNLKRQVEELPPQAMDPGIAWYYIDLVHTIKPQQVISARGCNMSYRREIFTKHGVWFDERFRGSAVREESDFCLRLRKTGYKIWYSPEAYLVHLAEETGGCHDISTRSLKYQTTFYHNHFLMALKNLTITQQLRLYAKLFDCHVLGNPPCNKSGSPIKILTRGGFYGLGFIDAIATLIKSNWDDGQSYTKQDLASTKQ